MSSQLDDTHTKLSIDFAIKSLAIAIMNDIGWADTLDHLKILSQSKGRVENGKEWSGDEWFGAHLQSELENIIHDDALVEGKCPLDGCDLEIKIEKQTRDYPGHEWLECTECGEEYPLGRGR